MNNTQNQPNIIFIIADDLGYGDLSFFGNPFVNTPNLEKLGNEGIALMQHYSASPLCAPARGALLTGRYSHRTGAVDVPSNRGLDRINLKETTIADAMKQAGYATGMVGKWHNGVHDMQYHPNSRGFDRFVGFLNGGMDYWQWVLDENGQSKQADGRYLTDVFTQEAIDFIKSHQHYAFFLYLAYNAPHRPFQSPLDLFKKYYAMGFTKAVSHIYAMIERMDMGIGKILGLLERYQLKNNTIVVFTSDNGPYMGGRGENSALRFNGSYSGQKGDVLEGGIRVPAIVRWPGYSIFKRDMKMPYISPGTRTYKFFHFIDWFPTLLSLTDEPYSTKFPLDGRNKIEVLLNRKEFDDKIISFWQFNRYQPVYRCNAAVRQDRYKLYYPPIPEAMAKFPSDNQAYSYGLTHPHELKLVHFNFPQRQLSQPQSPLLFDLESDSRESINIAKNCPDIVDSMVRLYDDWFAEVTTEWQDAVQQNQQQGKLQETKIQIQKSYFLLKEIKQELNK